MSDPAPAALPDFAALLEAVDAIDELAAWGVLRPATIAERVTSLRTLFAATLPVMGARPTLDPSAIKLLTEPERVPAVRLLLANVVGGMLDGMEAHAKAMQERLPFTASTRTIVAAAGAVFGAAMSVRELLRALWVLDTQNASPSRSLGELVSEPD